MRQSMFMAIAAILAFVIGLAFLLIPAQLLSLYGITLDPDGQWIARGLGSAFAGIAVTTWFARNVPQGTALRAIMLGDFVLTAVGLVAAVLYAIYGSANALIWPTAVVYLFLSVGFGYFRFAK